MKTVGISLFLLFGIFAVGYSKTLPRDTDSVVMERPPQYPGGINAFNNYLATRLHYPDAARLICISGKVFVSFVVDENGKVTNVAPVNCIGAGCESEAVKVVQLCRPWKPGTQNGKPIKVFYTVPINFTMESNKVYMDNLKASDYGFVFNIKGALRSIDEAELVLGNTFKPDRIESAEPLISNSVDQKFGVAKKKEVYLITIK